MEPTPQGTVRVEVIKDGSWVEVTLPAQEVLWLITAWTQDPEETMRDYFKSDPPEGRVRELEQEIEVKGETKTDKTAEDLGL